MEIEYRAADGVRALIGGLGRTEDIRFSPGNRRLAMVGFNAGRVVVLDVEIAKTSQSIDVAVTAGVEIASPSLTYPHGADFIDDETLAVANRLGDLVIFKLPSAGTGACELSPIQVIAPPGGSRSHAPGSVTALRRADALCELLVCDNEGHSVTRHLIDQAADCRVVSSDVLLRKWVNLPDGICVSRDRRWIAISNHNTHGILLYDWSSPLGAQAAAAGILRGVRYPHGIRFSADGRYIFVADAGAPLVHIYAHGGEGWRGAWSPAASIRIKDEELFLRSRGNPQEGGPKGIDIDSGMNVLVATSEHQPLLFLDVRAMLAEVRLPSPALDAEYEAVILEHAESTRNRVVRAEARAAAADKRAAAAEAMAACQERRAEKFKAKAARAKAKARAARMQAALDGLVAGRPFARLYAAFKRPT